MGIDTIINLVFDIWIWSLTFGIAYPVIGFILLSLFLAMSCCENLVSAILWSATSYALSFGFLCSAGFLASQYKSMQWSTIVFASFDVFTASTILASIYITLQLTFFSIVRARSYKDICAYFLLLILCNSCAALMNYLWITTFWYAT